MVQWHAHEMFFGFGWAVLGGFLLTATKNWVKVRGYSGYVLIFLAVAWLLDRFGMWFQGVWQPSLFLIANNLFIVAISGMLARTLIQGRKEDAYKDNYLFLLMLPVFLVSKNLMLSHDYFQIGLSMVIGLFRLAFLVMLERTLPQFMKSAFQISIYMNPALNRVIKITGMLLVFESLLSPQISGWISLILSILLTYRLIRWKPNLALRRTDLAVMYFGYMALTAQLLIVFLGYIIHPEWSISTGIHVFTFGVMGLIIPAMLIRIAKGHTGRRVIFDVFDKIALWLMFLGFVLRIIAPKLSSIEYGNWILLAASCWFLCFSLLSWRYIPFLIQPRVDGKEH